MCEHQWQFHRVSTTKSQEKKNLYLNLKVWGVVFIFIFFLFIGVRYLSKRIVIPLKEITDFFSNLSEGSIPKPLKMQGNDEIVDLADVANRMQSKLKNIRRLALEVGRGSFNTKVSVFEGRGSVGIALQEMKENLQKVALEQARQDVEERKRSWFNEGMAAFNELFRTETNNLHDLANEFLVQLIKYIGAIQGGIFVINDVDSNDPFIEQLAGRAYDSKRVHRKRIELAEGLIGRCIDERERIVMQNVPEDYINITSGLGAELPRHLLLVPIKTVEEVFGAIELASFDKFEEQKIDLVERLGEVVASTFATVKGNQRNAELLRKTKLQAEELASQEEELRQNIEEMKATQEEASRKEEASIGFANTVNHTMLRADFGISGDLLYANSRFLDLVGYTMKEISGGHISKFLASEDDIGIFRQSWSQLVRGGKHFEKEVLLYTQLGKRWVYITLTAVFDVNGGVDHILLLALDIDDLIVAK